MPVTGTGLCWLEEVNALLKYQLVGFVQVSTQPTPWTQRPGSQHPLLPSHHPLFPSHRPLLVGVVQGVSKLWSGKLVRPGGFRGVDFVLQARSTPPHRHSPTLCPSSHQHRT